MISIQWLRKEYDGKFYFPVGDAIYLLNENPTNIPVGSPCVIQYDPGDQYCSIIPLSVIEAGINLLKEKAKIPI